MNLGFLLDVTYNLDHRYVILAVKHEVFWFTEEQFTLTLRRY